jgi:hypothetical protein
VRDKVPALVTREGETIRKGRISPALRTALTLIVHEGLTVNEAAKRTGYQGESLAKALLKPHVRAFKADVKRAWLASRTEKAWLTVAELADNSASDDIRLKASKLFLDAAGELTPDDKGGAGPRQLIQIITRSVQMAGQPLGQRLPGVVEPLAGQYIDVTPSDSGEV